MRDQDLYFYTALGLGFVLFVGTIVVIDVLRRRKVEAWAEGELGGDGQCAACGSREVTELMPQVYVCGACGHEGGDGLPALERQRWRKQVEAWSPEQRRAKGSANLEEGARLLISAEGPLGLAQRAVEASQRTLQRAEDRAAYIEQALAANHDALEELFRAHKMLDDAAWLLHQRESGVALPSRVNGIAHIADFRALSELRDQLAQLAAALKAPPG